MWSGERLTRKQLTSRPDHLWPETLRENGTECQAEGEAKVFALTSITHENCEGFVSLTLRTRNLRRPIKNARKKLETPMAPRYALQD